MLSRRSNRQIAYVCLQATVQGQASYAHVHRIVEGLRDCGWFVELFEPKHRGSSPRGVVGRAMSFAWLQLGAVVRLGRYDVLYVRAHPLALIVSLAAYIRRMPVVQECNGTYLDAFVAWPAIRRFSWLVVGLQRWQYRHATAVVAVTPGLRAWVRREAPGQRVEVIPNGADTTMFSPDATPETGLPGEYAVFVGALAPWQGVEVILEALESSSWPRDVTMLIAGDGDLRLRVVEVAERNQQLVYMGAVEHARVPGILAGALASLIPMDMQERDQYGLSPIKLYESMAAGVPVVASDIASLGETVSEHECGLLVPPGDAAALAERIAELSTDPLLSARLGDNGRQAAVRFHDWNSRAKDTSRLLREVGRVDPEGDSCGS